MPGAVPLLGGVTIIIYIYMYIYVYTVIFVYAGGAPLLGGGEQAGEGAGQDHEKIEYIYI